MAKVRMRAVIYALPPFQQTTMSGLYRELPSKIHHKVVDNWHGVSLLFAPLIGVYSYAHKYQEKEKMEHRY